ncbi:hypothetical protein [Paraburkholderia dioscoreae]|nr:hypothetical protein [Paraburkholderia dioscoreae]
MPTITRARVSFRGFMIIAPGGLRYFPPCRTMTDAYAEIRERSLYDGEPGWVIQPTDDEGEPNGKAIKVRGKSRRITSVEQSSRGDA